MAAVTKRSRVLVRAARPGEGPAIASLWRELWDAHEGWGGYPGRRDPLVYAQLGTRLDDDARVRAGQPILGRHIHLVAALDGSLAGQVEGWFERQGVDPQTPHTCEVRSLIVASWARGAGVGAGLLEALADAASTMTRGTCLVLSAEVLEPNPAHAFYARLGYAPVSWSLRAASDPSATVPASMRPPPGESFSARVAEPRDALAVCILDATLASRRRALGDLRYDRPRAVDASTVGALAALLNQGNQDGRIPGGTAELVTVDGHGRVRASASFARSTLDPPFAAAHRSVLSRFAADPAFPAEPLVAPLIALGRRLAAQGSADTIELTELSPPGTRLHAAGLASGGTPWSRILTKAITPRAQF
jgi:GNAT superfamily N-acetyltransferase